MSSPELGQYPMAQTKVFVGRQEELDRFDEFLRDRKGQALLVIGQQGMGKTVLLDRMLLAAREHPDLKCTAVRYEVTPTDSVDVTLGQIMDEPFTVSLGDKVLGEEKRRNKHLKALAGVFPMGENLTVLVASLRRRPNRNTRDQFLAGMQSLSVRLPETSRIVFAVDPEKYMQKDCDQSWAVVIPKLPPKIKIIFAQRPDDALATNSIVMTLPNVYSVTSDEGLDTLSEKDIDDMLNQRATEVGHAVDVLRKAVAPYKGHPYAVPAALDLIQYGMSPEELPSDPTPQAVAATQWKHICRTHTEAIPLFQAYAVLEVPVPDELVAAVSNVDNTTRTYLLAQSFLGGLLRSEGEGRRIYHSLLSDHILAQIPDEEKTAFHRRAVDIYRERLNADTKPDALSALRLPHHVRATEGDQAFVLAFINECSAKLRMLGLLDEFITLNKEALTSLAEGSEEFAAIFGNLGVVYQTRGEFDEAETMYRKALEIAERAGFPEGIASAHGNLGNVYQIRGELDQAETMYQKALEMDIRLMRLEGMADDYTNLGVVYQTRGDLDEAETLYRKSLKIYEDREHLEGIANAYGNLGNVYQIRGDLDAAETMYRKALEFDERLGHLEGMADRYSQLGLVYQARGDLDEAEAMHGKALEIDTRLGRLEGMANSYGNLGNVYRTRGDIDEAETMYRKALEIDEGIGRPEGVATAYSNLGIVYQARGDFEGAETMYRKALEIDTRLGRLEGVAHSCVNLGVMYRIRGVFESAREHWTQARDLFQQIGMPHMVERVQGWLDGLGENSEGDEEES